MRPTPHLLRPIVRKRRNIDFAISAAASAVSGARAAGRLTADNVTQQRRLDTLDALLSEQLHEMRRVSAIRAEQGLAAAIAAFQQPMASRMPVIRKLLSDMDAEERRLLDQRRLRERSVAAGASVATVLAVASAILLALFGAAALRRYIDERRAIDRLKNDLVGIVAHELRSPLTAIHGALGLMRAGDPLDTRRDRLVTMATANSDRLLRLVNTMLDLEKIESGKLDLHYEVFTLTSQGKPPSAGLPRLRLRQACFSSTKASWTSRSLPIVTASCRC